MVQYKKYFLIPFIIFSFICAFYSISNVDGDLFSSPWLGPILVFLPFIFFILIHMSRTIARTSTKLWPIIIFSTLGVIISSLSINIEAEPFILSVAGLSGNLLYIFWYSVNGRQENEVFEKGRVLPNFTLKTAEGHIITSNLIKSSPALILVYRGNWCPLCMKQINEIANISEQLDKQGITIYLLGAQSLVETKKIAQKYSDKPMQFLHDPELRTLIQLNLVHIGGIPKGLAWTNNDTAYPTLLLTAKGGEILWSDQSPNYRVRPKPNIFLELTQSIKTKDIDLAQPIIQP